MMNGMLRLLALGSLATCVASAAPQCGSTPRISHSVKVVAQTNLPSGVDGDYADVHKVVRDAMAQFDAQTGGLDEMMKGLTAAIAGAAPSTASTETRSAGPQPWLGVGTDELSEDVRSLLPDGVVGGLIVRHVEADGPAAKAGIQANDILLKLDDQILLNPAQLRQLLQLRKDGDKVALKGLRKGKEIAYEPSLVMKEHAAEDEGGNMIVIGQPAGGLKMELPAEIKRMLESGMGGATVFSTSIVIRAGSGGGSQSFSSGGSFSSSGGKSGISAKTVNGQTTITYNGEEVFSGPTSGRVTTKSVNNNGEESAAAYDGDKVIWESKSGAADQLKK